MSKLPDENDRSIQDVSNEKPAHIGRYQKSKILFQSKMLGGRLWAPKKLWSNRESDSFMRWKSSLFRLQTRRLPGVCSDFLLEGDCCHNSKLDVKLPDENDRSIQDVSNEKPAHIGRYQKSKILFRFLFATP